MTKFYIEVLAKARLAQEHMPHGIEKIITTTLTVHGDVIKDKEYIEVYTRYDEYYDYDITKAEPLAKDEYQTINSSGDKSYYYSNHGFEIREILEIYEEDVKYTEG